MKPIMIAVDAMGGDHGISVIIPATLAALPVYPHVKFVLVGDKEQIEAMLSQHGFLLHPNLSVVHAPEQVEMNEAPSHALRFKKKSSMRLAINLVKDKQADAVVSAGNTGALMATARFVLKTLPGIDRPAIIAVLPGISGTTRVIDLGANVDSSPLQLFQFALMGAALIKAVSKKDKPKVGLLNVGVEDIKGNEQVKQTAHLFSHCHFFDYCGYVEGDSFYLGHVDLVVCDGFVGNVALKASEGLARLMLSRLVESFSKNKWTKLSAFLAKPALKSLKKEIDPAKYNGASLLGLNGVVIKSHGSADTIAFQNALHEAILQVEHGVVDLVKEQFNTLSQQGIL